MSQFTKTAIRSSLIRLLEEKPLNKISVMDIARDCGINRNTFYYHYSDIPALLEEFVREESDAIIRKYPSIETLEEGVKAVLEFALNRKTAVMHIYHSVNREVFEMYLWRVLDYVTRNYLKTILGERSLQEEDMETMATSLKSICFGFIADWMEKDMSDEQLGTFSRFCELAKGELEVLLSRCRRV